LSKDHDRERTDQNQIQEQNQLVGSESAKYKKRKNKKKDKDGGEEKEKEVGSDYRFLRPDGVDRNWVSDCPKDNLRTNDRSRAFFVFVFFWQLMNPSKSVDGNLTERGRGLYDAKFS